ncbi:MAG: hypothetical protein AAFZ18_15255 [Myxococcota bacterium]
MTIGRWIFFIDRIEASSYPVTETGYALLYRAWSRAREVGASIHIVYPDTLLEWDADHATVEAHLLHGFGAMPYAFYSSQRESYEAGSDLGSAPCHTEGRPERIRLDEADVIVFRQETGPQRIALLEALLSVETKLPVYLSPRLALAEGVGSKVLPGRIAPNRVPRGWSSASVNGSATDKVAAALKFLEVELGQPETAIAKPTNGDNGVGITILGRSPLSDREPEDTASMLARLVQTHGDVIVQEYLPSVRRPADLADLELAEVPTDRRDFGEVRFLLIDGEVPRDTNGQPLRCARRVPTDRSLLADSGISHPTTLSAEELEFLAGVGKAYRQLGIKFGGGDLIRTADPSRPFLFTDAAQSVCGHAVVTGALNGAPYIVVDLVLDSVERSVEAFRRFRRPPRRPQSSAAGMS